MPFSILVHSALPSPSLSLPVTIIDEIPSSAFAYDTSVVIFLSVTRDMSGRRIKTGSFFWEEKNWLKEGGIHGQCPDRRPYLSKFNIYAGAEGQRGSCLSVCSQEREETDCSSQHSALGPTLPWEG